tara:strand:+ start:309 stop:521 length:213 start_codon:yes stop_codon:yes gene_type:complete
MRARDGLMGRAQRHAEGRAAGRRRSISEEAGGLPGVSAFMEGDDVILEGRGLLDRWIREASLRNIGRTAP